jgi:hypothetical protein
LKILALTAQKDSEVNRKSSQSSNLSESFTAALKSNQSKNKKWIFLLIALAISLTILISTIVPVIYFIFYNDSNNNMSSETPSFLVSRYEWGAEKQRIGTTKLSLPISRIIVAQTGGSPCNNEVSVTRMIYDICVYLNFHFFLIARLQSAGESSST